MKRFITYGSINQFRQTIKDVQHTAQFVSYDNETKEVTIDRDAKMPTVTAIGTEKIHGTNAAVCFSEPDGFWVQSRKNIITPEKDNAGCAFAAYDNENAWVDIIRVLADDWNIDLTENIISVYYEWSGGNIQKNSALSGLDKKAMIFQHFKVSPIEPQLINDDTEEDPKAAKWLETSILPNNQPLCWLDIPSANIFNIMNFPTFKIEIDFNKPLMSQNKMIEMVEELEKDSLVGKQFGIDKNIGEGIVFSFKYNGNVHRFKVKGEKHSKSKVKSLTPVNEVKEQLKQEIAQQVTPAWRLEQMYDLANDVINGTEPDVKNMGTFFKLLNQDILKEESDIIAGAGLEPKEIFGIINKIGRIWYQEQLNNLYNLGQ